MKVWEKLKRAVSCPSGLLKSMNSKDLSNNETSNNESIFIIEKAWGLEKKKNMEIYEDQEIEFKDKYDFDHCHDMTK